MNGRVGQKQADGTWLIDGLSYGRSGEAGEPFSALDFGTVIFRDAENLRQPMALNFNTGIEYGSEEEAAPITLTLNWICHGADFLRSSSWTDSAFDLATMDARAGYIGADAEFARVETDAPGQYHPGPTIVTSYFTAQCRAKYIPSGTEYWDYYDEVVYHLNALAEFYEMGVTYEFGSIIDAVRVGGYVYMTAEGFFDNEGDYMGDTWILKYTQAISEVREPFPGSDPYLSEGDLTDSPWTLIWGTHVGQSPYSREVGVDIDMVVATTPVATTGPEAGTTSDRVVVALYDDATEETTVVSLDALTGGDSLSCYGLSGVAYAKDHKIWVSDGSYIAHYLLDEDGQPSQVWSTEDWILSHEDESLEIKLLGFAGDNLICDFTGETVYEDVTVNLISNDRFSFGTEYTETYEDVSAGLCYLAGTMSLNADTGEIVSRSYNPGTPIEVDSQVLIHHQLISRPEQLFTGPDEQYVSRAYRGDPLTKTDEPAPTEYGGYIPCVWGPIPRMFSWFSRRATEPHFLNVEEFDEAAFLASISGGIVKVAPEEFDNFPYAGGVETIAPNVDWNDANETAVAAHIATQSTEWQAVYDDRLDPTGTVLYDYLKIEAPCWGRPPGSTEPEYLGIQTWTSVKPAVDRWLIGLDPEVTCLRKRVGSSGGGFVSDSPRFLLSGEDPVSVPSELLWDDVVLDPDTWADTLDHGVDELVFAAPVSGAIYKSTQQFIFLNIELRPQYRSPDPLSGDKTASVGGLLIRGPIQGATTYDADTFEYSSWDFAWTAHRPDGSIAWQYQLAGSGGIDINPTTGQSGTPVAVKLSDGTLAVATFCTYGEETIHWKGVILNALTGEEIEVFDSPEDMLEVIFDGTHFVSQNSRIRWGPSL